MGEGRLRYALQPLLLVDLCVVVVFWLDLVFTSSESQGLQVLRAVRLLRLLTLLKMERKTNSFATISTVLSIKRSELTATLFIALVLLIVSSTSMFYTENETQPDTFSSIPATMWWSVT